MLWGKPDGYSFSPGVDETPFNDGSETADPEAIEVFDEVSVPAVGYDDILMCFWLFRDITLPTVEKSPRGSPSSNTRK